MILTKETFLSEHNGFVWVPGNFRLIWKMSVFTIRNRWCAKLLRIYRNFFSINIKLADPGEARGCSTNSLSQSAFSSHSFTAAKAKRLEPSTSSYRIELSKSRRASKSHHWFQSYGHVTKGVDLAYWWSFIGKGLCLQPAQQACFHW